MSDGLKKKTPSKKVESVMIYMNKAERSALNAFAKQNDLFVTQVAREGIKMRMSGNDYNHRRRLNYESRIQGSENQD